MKLSIVSDLHIEHASWPARNMLGDVRIFAGDIATETMAGMSPVRYIASFPERTPAIFVPGNHDFYASSIEESLAQWRKEAEEYPWVHVLYNDDVVIDGQHFLGTTLWSDLSTADTADEYALWRFIENNIGDFFVIFGQGQDVEEGRKLWRALGQENARDYGSVKTFTVSEMVEEFKKARRFLENNCTKDSIVITHFPPDQGSQHPRFEGSPLNPYFTNQLELLSMPQAPKLWVFGHTHDPYDYTKEKTRLLCHPRGYPHEGQDEYHPQVIDI